MSDCDRGNALRAGTGVPQRDQRLFIVAHHQLHRQLVEPRKRARSAPARAPSIGVMLTIALAPRRASSSATVITRGISDDDPPLEIARSAFTILQLAVAPPTRRYRTSSR